MTTPARVVVAGGGTAGHVEPALALADALRDREPSAEVTVLGTAEGLETRLVPARGYPLEVVPRVPLPRRPSTDWLTLPGRLRGAVSAAGEIFDRLDVDVLVGFGGYVSMPAYLAARRRRLPFVVHEANVRPGVANWVGARLTPFVAVSSAQCSLPHASLTGIPLRPAIENLDRVAMRSQARERLGLAGDRTTLLVFGGSQGAERINRATAGAVDRLRAAGVQVLHAVGAGNPLPESVPGAVPYVAVPYLDRMDLAYAAADVALCRSGAMTCAEVAAVGLPALFVPYPWSNGEQELNAAELVAAGAARLVPDAELTAERLLQELLPLVTDDELLRRRGSAARSVGRPDAAARLLALVDAAAGGAR